MQWRLLDVAALDTRAAQLTHRASALPQAKELARLESEHAAAQRLLVQARTEHQDVQRQVAKAEADVQQVRDRAARDQARLDSGVGSPKDLQSLQSEIVSLARRQSELEDVELEVMERSEALAAEVEKHTAAVGELSAAMEQAAADRDSALGEISDEAEQVARQRADAVAGIDAPLVALYEKIRQSTGMGAAPLVARRCEGCRLELMGTQLSRLRDAAPDEVLRCEECTRILVRTGESGL